MSHSRECQLCGDSFTTTRIDKLYCTDRCRVTAKQSRLKAQRAAESMLRDCSECGQSFQTTKRSQINCSKRCTRAKSKRRERERESEMRKRERDSLEVKPASRTGSATSAGHRHSFLIQSGRGAWLKGECECGEVRPFAATMEVFDPSGERLGSLGLSEGRISWSAERIGS